MKTPALILILIINQNVTAQQTGKVIVFFEPVKAKVLLDGKPYTCSPNSVRLPLGKHHVQAWDSTYRMYNDSFEIKESGFAIVSKQLKRSDLYKDYREKLFFYKSTRISSRFIFPALLLGYGARVYREHNSLTEQMNNYRDLAMENKALYENAISLSDLDLYWLRYTTNKEYYDEVRLKHNAMLKRSAYVIPAAACVTGVLLYFSFKLKRPVYYEARPALFALQNIGIRRQSDALCLNLNFAIR